jgi:predicted HTH transcriptional regulator
MKPSETAVVDTAKIRELKNLVAEGEGQHLEFKRKAAFPEKIVRELIAFANSGGGTLLVGVDDDKSIPGVKYPEEESYVIIEALQKYCRPSIVYHETILPINAKKFIIRIDVPPSLKKPHFLKTDIQTPKQCFVREKDMSIKASTEMEEIIRRRNKRDVKFSFGPAEMQLMKYLDQYHHITLQEFQRLTKLNRFKARRKLILLVLANVLQITASEKGDVFSRL